MKKVTVGRLAELRMMIGKELGQLLFGEMPKFCMAFNMPADPIAEVAGKHGLPYEEAYALASAMNAEFAAQARWPD